MEPSKQELDAIEQEQPNLAAFDPLEDLFTDAMLHRAKKAKRPADPSLRNALDATAKRMKEVFSLPENWERTRGVALIHRESGTLLGNFSEYLHRTVKGSRRLVREALPIAIAANEYVSGLWWLGAHVRDRVAAADKWTTQRQAVIDVVLPELGVAHPVTEVIVGLYLGAITRVELAADTCFSDMQGTTLLFLPARTNVLECLSLECKIALRKTLGL